MALQPFWENTLSNLGKYTKSLAILSAVTRFSWSPFTFICARRHCITCRYSRGRNGTKKSIIPFSIKREFQKPPAGWNERTVTQVADSRFLIKCNFVWPPRQKKAICLLMFLCNTDSAISLSNSLSFMSSRFRPSFQNFKAVCVMISPPSLLQRLKRV